MERKSGKQKMSRIEGTASSMVVEDRLQPHQAHQFADTKCRTKKNDATLMWGDIYTTIK